MVHVQTGNGLDVCYTRDSTGRKVLAGLWHRESRQMIPLSAPGDLISVLQAVTREIMEHNARLSVSRKRKPKGEQP